MDVSETQDKELQGVHFHSNSTGVYHGNLCELNASQLFFPRGADSMYSKSVTISIFILKNINNLQQMVIYKLNFPHSAIALWFCNRLQLQLKNKRHQALSGAPHVL